MYIYSFAEEYELIFIFLCDIFGPDPAYKTFDEIIPKFKRRLAYWKQFSLSKIGKARVIEMFLASKLIYGIKFYPLPEIFQKQI